LHPPLFRSFSRVLVYVDDAPIECNWIHMFGKYPARQVRAHQHQDHSIAALSLECREHACKPACCGAASILPPPQPQQGQHPSRPNRRRRAIDTYLDTSISSIRRHAIQPKQRMPTFDFDGESNLHYQHATTVEPAITTQPTMLSMIMVLLVIVMCMECCMQCIIF
jgi:hypothetical protein